MNDPELFSRLCQRLNALRGEMIDFQKKLTAIPALAPKNGGDGEWDKTQMILQALREFGLSEIEEVHAPQKEAQNGLRPNLIATVPGKAEQTVWIMAHTDVVPTGDRSLWEQDPWTVFERDGKLIGRGVEDNQQGLTSAIFTARALLEESIVPKQNLGLVICADEETGSAYGLDYILEQRPELFRADDLIVVPDAGAPDGTLIEVAEKSLVWFKFVVLGKQVHASMPQDGNNAHRAAADLVVRLESLYQTFATNNELFTPPISTFEPTRREINVPNVNTIPGEEIFYMDCRILPEIPVAQVEAEVKKICAAVEKDRGVRITLSRDMVLEAAPATPADAPIVGALQKAIQEVYRVEATPQGIGGGTVAASFRRLGLPVAVWCTMDQMAHQPNEYCVIDHMLKDAQVFAHLCMDGESS